MFLKERAEKVFRCSGVATIVKNSVLGTLPGLMICIVLGGYLKSNMAEAGPETFLPAQDITLSGNVTAPSCTVSLENDRLTFSGKTVEEGQRGSEEQVLRLNLSKCEADSVGVLFKAEYWPDNPVRGMLSGSSNHRRSLQWYYTIGPGSQDSDIPWTLQLAKDSPAPEVDKIQGDKKQDVYFSLAEVNYWYDLKEPLRDDDALTIPFSVRVHHEWGNNKRNAGQDDRNDSDLNASFTIQLSWR